MFQQLVSRIQDDDNPRLHRVPFMLLWVMSYGLGWFALRTFEQLWLNGNFCNFLRWLKGGQYFPGSDTQWYHWWREDLFVGALFAVMLSISQTWLLKKRYGYVPRFWGIATFIGAVLAGFGYPRIGLANYYTPTVGYFVDFLVWFGVLGLSQSLVMFRVNRQAWHIAFVGLLAGVISGAIYYFAVFGQMSGRLALLTGIVIQIVGTGMVMMRLMATPREGIVPKRDVSEKSKNRISDSLHPVTFLALWVGVFFLSRLTLGFLWELHSITWVFPKMADFNRWLYYASDIRWILSGSFHIGLGIVMGIGQKWLIEKYCGIKVKHLIVCNAIGWAIAGIGLSQFWFDHSTPMNMRLIWLAAYFIVPALFQTLPMLRSIRRGWFWIAAGFIATIPLLVMWREFAYLYIIFNIVLLSTLIFALSSGLILIFATRSQAATEKLKGVEEVL